MACYYTTLTAVHLPQHFAGWHQAAKQCSANSPTSMKYSAALASLSRLRPAMAIGTATRAMVLILFLLSLSHSVCSSWSRLRRSSLLTRGVWQTLVLLLLGAAAAADCSCCVCERGPWRYWHRCSAQTANSRMWYSYERFLLSGDACCCLSPHSNYLTACGLWSLSCRFEFRQVVLWWEPSLGYRSSSRIIMVSTIWRLETAAWHLDWRFFVYWMWYIYGKRRHDVSSVNCLLYNSIWYLVRNFFLENTRKTA